MKGEYEYAISQVKDDGNTRLEDEEAKVWNWKRKKIRSDQQSSIRNRQSATVTVAEW
jgi:hypothetical protein